MCNLFGYQNPGVETETKIGLTLWTGKKNNLSNTI